LVLLTVGDLNFPALTMRMAFVTLRAFHVVVVVVVAVVVVVVVVVVANRGAH
jgi:hypothetical protein